MRAILILFLTLICPLAPAAAADLYTGEIAVVDQDAAERARAIPLALQQVLGKLSGLRQFDDRPQVQFALEGAQALLLSYHYRNAELLLADGTRGRELRLVARFSPPDVDGLLRQLELPLWQPERPPLTVWLVIDDGVGRRIMPVEYDYTRVALEDTALRRGLAVNWPEADAEGVFAVDEQLLWGGYTEDIAQPGGDPVLIIAARREGAQWSVRFNLGAEGQHLSWRRDDIDLQAALVGSFEDVIDQLAASGTIAAEDRGTWSLEVLVAGLSGAADYQRCLGYLQGLGVVETVGVVGARPGQVTFRLQLSAAPRYFEQALASGAVLAPVETGEGYLLVAPVPSSD